MRNNCFLVEFFVRNRLVLWWCRKYCFWNWLFYKIIRWLDI